MPDYGFSEETDKKCSKILVCVLGCTAVWMAIPVTAWADFITWHNHTLSWFHHLTQPHTELISSLGTTTHTELISSHGTTTHWADSITWLNHTHWADFITRHNHTLSWFHHLAQPHTLSWFHHLAQPHTELFSTIMQSDQPLQTLVLHTVTIIQWLAFTNTTLLYM